jgi:hypothetical protein
MIETAPMVLTVNWNKMVNSGRKSTISVTSTLPGNRLRSSHAKSTTVSEMRIICEVVQHAEHAIPAPFSSTRTKKDNKHHAWLSTGNDGIYRKRSLCSILMLPPRHVPADMRTTLNIAAHMLLHVVVCYDCGLKQHSAEDVNANASR